MSQDFDLDLLVIGAGSGGVRAARISAGYGARVAIVERGPLGGTCVNAGCIPKKLLAYGAEAGHALSHLPGYGWTIDGARFDWAALRDHKDREIARLNGIYRRLLSDAGVRILQGHARLEDAHTVSVAGERLRARDVLIATGGEPVRPDIPGAELTITSDEAFHLPRLPERVLVVGGGYIAVEFASIFHGLGSRTTLLYRGELFLRGFERGLREHLRDRFRETGLTLNFGADLAAVERRGDHLVAVLKDGSRIETDAVFCATGRRPLSDGLGPGAQSLARDARGHLLVDRHYRCSTPSIRAIGDVIGTAHGRLPLTPVATAEGMAVAASLFRPEAFRELDYRGIPTAVFSLPNLASVGLSEEQAHEAGLTTRVYETRFRPLKLTLTDDSERCYMKLVVDAASDRVLGCHMAGADAGEIIQGLAVALKAGASKRVFDDTLGIHPTAAEEFVTMRTARAA